MGKSVTLGVSNFNCLDLSMSQRQIGTGIAELLVSALNKEKGDTIILIERNQISKVLEEQKIYLSGMTEQSAVEKVGKVLGVKILITGDISIEGDAYAVNARAVSTETGKILASYKTALPITEFENKAKHYIIQRRESTAFYFGYLSNYVTPVTGVTTTKNGVTISDVSLLNNMLDVIIFGGRAFFSDYVAFDIAMLMGYRSSGDHALAYVDNISFKVNNNLDSVKSFGTSFGTAFTLYGVYPINPATDFFIGPGYELWSIGGGEFLNFSSVTLSYGIEWRFSSGIGIDIFGKYPLFNSSDIETIYNYNTTIMKFPMAKFGPSFAANLIFYF